MPIIVFLLSGCSNSQEEIWSSSKKPINYSYISCYLTSIDSLKTVYGEQNNKLTIAVLAKGKTELYSSIDFSRIAQYYGDTSYNNNEWLETSTQIFADSIKEINLYNLDETTSNKHNLNKETSIAYQSYYSFIKSDYNVNIDVNDSCTLEYFNKSNMKLLSSDFSLETSDINIKQLEIEIKLHSGVICKKVISLSK